MDGFTICIAGLNGKVMPIFESTAVYCREYLTDDAPEVEFVVSREDLFKEQAFLDQEAIEEGLKRRKFAEPFLERSVIQRRFAEELLRHQTLLMHGSTVAVDGQAYLFTAACGTGKSTHTRLWRETFGERAVMVNDDKPFLKIQEQGVLAFGSPWSGKHGLANNVCMPLRGICILKRGGENRIRRIGRQEAEQMLRHQCFAPETGEAQIIPLLERLMEVVPLWEMACTKEREAAEIAYRAMSLAE